MAIVKILDAATGNGRSSTLQNQVESERMFCFTGTIGGATITIDLSNDGTTWFNTGAVFATGDLTPKIVKVQDRQHMSVIVSGASGTTATVEIA